MSQPNQANQGLSFNRQISLGDLIVALGGLASLVGLWVNLNNRVTRLEVLQEYQNRPRVERLAPTILAETKSIK